MSRQSERKAGRKIAAIHNKKLNELLNEFFGLLDRQPKPSDEEVRSAFKKQETTWKVYCDMNSLDLKASLLFNARVAYEWERKYTKR